jgi:hypothetical protein
VRQDYFANSFSEEKQKICLLQTQQAVANGDIFLKLSSNNFN